MAYFLAVLAAACLAATPAHAGPILDAIVVAVTLATSAAAAIGGTVIVGSITVGMILTPLVTTAIGLGISLIFAPRPHTPPPEAGTIAVQQTMPYRLMAYGRTRVAGAVMLKEAYGPYLGYVSALTGHLIDGFEQLFLNDDQVTVVPTAASAQQIINGVTYQIAALGSTNWVSLGAPASPAPAVGTVFTASRNGTTSDGTGTVNPYSLISGTVAAGVDGRYGAGTIQIDTRQGLIPETFYSILTFMGTIWPATATGDGIASLAMLCQQIAQQQFSTVFPYAGPMPSVILRGWRVFDPRDATQDPANAGTFKFSQNPALAILHFLCFSPFGYRHQYSAAILPVVSSWIDAANHCDDLVPLKAGGTEPRYTLGGSITAEAARITPLLTMLQSCDGFLSRRGQSYVLQVGFYEAPSVALTDDDIVGFSIQTDVATEDKVNEATANYCSPACGYISVISDPQINTVDQAARGGNPRKSQLDLPWVQSTGQASRLLTREMFRQSVSVRGTLIVKWSGLNAVWERWFAVNSNSIPRLSGVVVENRKAVINPKTRTASIEFILSGPALDAYNPSTQESAPPSVPQRPQTVGLPIPANVSVVPEMTTDDSGAASVSLAVSCDEPFFNAAPWVLNYSVQTRLSAVGAGAPGSWTQQTFNSPTIAGGRVTMQTAVVLIGVTLDVQVATVGVLALSTWSATVTVNTNTTTLAPLPPTWVSAVGASGHATLTVKAPNSANFFGVQFYRAATGSPFSSATAIGAVVTGARNSNISYTDTHSAGTFDYFAVSQTAGAVSSAPAGPQTATIS